jgi:hypothetical protein
VQVVAFITGLVLAAIGVLHLVWLFSPWPLATHEALARTVVGRPAGDLPLAFFRPATVAVALALALAGYLVAVEGGVLASGLSEGLVNLGTLGVAVVLLARGALGLIQSGLRVGDAPASYRRLDLAVYSPLCLMLGGSALLVLLS